MSKGLDVNHINPFLQSCVTIFDQAAQTKLAIGKPSLTSLTFDEYIFALQVGLTGDLKGQVLLVTSENNAKSIASKMMFGMPVNELDEMASSALCELSNMIMGNTATLFSTNNIHIDITPPISIMGAQLHLQSSTTALKVPLLDNGSELISLFLCLVRE